MTLVHSIKNNKSNNKRNLKPKEIWKKKKIKTNNKTQTKNNKNLEQLLLNENVELLINNKELYMLLHATQVR